MTDDAEVRADAASVPRAASDPPADAGTATDERGQLLDLIDRMSSLLDRNDLVELEVEAGGTALVLRKPAAVAPAIVVPSSGGTPAAPAAGPPSAPADAPAQAAPAERPSVKAPLTGIWYASPAPGSAPYLHVGGEIAVGQVIGLIEAMKLFNEIKSDLAGRVVRLMAENGQLVKAKQPLVEVEPL